MLVTPVHIIGGFLGTGKTTALRAELAQRQGRERCAIIVNDFGEAAIDAVALGDTGAQITNIPGGCVCCTAPAGLAQALTALLDAVQPDRIFIEPSGLARPQDVVDMLSRGGLKGRVRLGPVLVFVDPARWGHHPLMEEQLEGADIIIANRCDLATPAQLDALRAALSARWPAPLQVVETTFGVLPPSVWEWPPDAGYRLVAPQQRTAPSTEGFVAHSFIFPPDARFSWDALRALLGGQAGVARLKGLFSGDAGWFRLDIAGGQLHFGPTAWRRDSRLDVIFHADAPALSTFGDRLAACVVAPDAPPPDTLALISAEGVALPLSRAALQALPQQIPDVSVVVAGRSGQGVWLRDVLPLLGQVAPGSQFMVVASDGLTTPPTPIADIGDAVLVHSLGDAPLPANQGGPFRLLAGGKSRCANVKGVARIRLVEP